MQKTYYHGTSIENALAIFKSQTFLTYQHTWINTEPGSIYFSNSEHEYQSLTDAITYGRITAAIQNSKYNGIAVIKITVYFEEDNDYFRPDNTADTNDGTSSEIDDIDLNRLIRNRNVTMDIRTLPAYEPLFRTLYLLPADIENLYIPDTLKKILLNNRGYMVANHALDCIMSIMDMSGPCDNFMDFENIADFIKNGMRS